jgi:hypothetical protein
MHDVESYNRRISFKAGSATSTRQIWLGSSPNFELPRGRTSPLDERTFGGIIPQLRCLSRRRAIHFFIASRHTVIPCQGRKCTWVYPVAQRSGRRNPALFRSGLAGEASVHSRRCFLGLLGAASLMRGQAMSTRTVTAAPRSKPSGKPFLASFVDIAREAGLRHPTVYGPVDHKDYIIETMGCGCAFIDYDNDGWMDLLVLSGSRVTGAPEGASTRLYRNIGIIATVRLRTLPLKRDCGERGGRPALP